MTSLLSLENDMRFAAPIWLLVGAAVVVIVVVLLARAERQRTRAIALLAGSRSLPPTMRLPSPLRRWSRVLVAGLAVAMGFVAVARPQKGLHWETVERSGTDVMLVLDTSRSMDADDVKPTRLGRAKLAIRDLIEKIPGDRVGLVAFAGDAVIESPMTLDHTALLETLDALDTRVVARGGTDIGHALETATGALATEPGHDKSVVLLTDGEDLEGRGLDAAKKAHSAGITIDAIGVGSPEGELVPAKDEHGKATGIVRDENGAPVRSKLDESGLRKIAEAGHGTYRPLGVDGRGLERLYAEALAPRAHAQASAHEHRVYEEWFGVPLAIALAAIVLDSLLGLPMRKRGGRARRRARGAQKAATLAAAGAAALVCLLAPGRAHASAASAHDAYAAGRYDEAQKEYAAESAKHPGDAALAFDLADAAYKAGKLDVARDALKRALAAADPKLQQDVLYNEGNALYRTGQGFGPDARAQTKEAWKGAIAAYDGALALNPKDADARFNRDLVARKLAELEEKEKNEKKNEPKQDQQQEQQQQQQKQQQQQDKSGQGQQQRQQPQDESGQQQPQDKSGQGQQQQQPQDKSGQQQPQDKSDRQGKGQKPEAQDGRAEHKPEAAPGKLDPRGARALLHALEGEERHALRTGNDAGAADDDTPKKDW